MPRLGYLEGGYFQQDHNQQDMIALTNQWRNLAFTPGLDQTQVQKLLDRPTTSGPSNTVRGILDYYSSHNGSTFYDRDWALLNQAVIDLNTMVQNLNQATLASATQSVSINSMVDPNAAALALLTGTNTPTTLPSNQGTLLALGIGATAIFVISYAYFLVKRDII